MSKHLAFRDAANGLWNAKNPLGDYLRRKKAKSGSRRAIVATARKIASIYYKMITEKADFDPQVLQNKTHEYLERKLQNLEKSIQRTKILLAESKVVSVSVI